MIRISIVLVRRIPDYIKSVTRRATPFCVVKIKIGKFFEFLNCYELYKSKNHIDLEKYILLQMSQFHELRTIKNNVYSPYYFYINLNSIKLKLKFLIIKHFLFLSSIILQCKQKKVFTFTR